MTPATFTSWLATPRTARRRTLVMGILNVTPDSFSDGGQFAHIPDAVAHALHMIHEGADLLDIGGESTRPGSQPVDAPEQLRRILPVIRALRSQSDVTLSVDTTSAAVAAAALDAGANIINDISAARDDAQMLPLAASRKAPIILMHMQGKPATMQINPVYRNVVSEVKKFLLQRLSYAESVGVHAADVLIDPGLGFGKTDAHNLALLGHLSELTELGVPVMVGPSRKGFIGRINGESNPQSRVIGTAAAVAWSVANGAAMVRVHDVQPICEVIRMIEAIQQRP